nr:DUF2334 domain-containing protein [uncultured Massilia sp.]
MSLTEPKIEPTIGQTPTTAAADTGAAAPAMQAPMLCVSIHDVAPATWPDCLRIVQAVREVADIPLTWLVVPHYHFRPERSAAMEACLDVVVERGDELALHGYSHLDTEANGGGLAKRFLRTVYTRKEGEFAALAEAEAQRRLELGLAWFAERGWPTHGFVPPAWLLGKGSWSALRASRFAYTTTFSHFHCLRDSDGNPIRHSVRSPSLVYAARNRGGRLLSPRVADVTARMLEKSPLVRFSLHPPDARYPELVRHMQRTLERLLVQREAVTKEECARRLVQAYERDSVGVVAGPAAADLVIVQDMVAPVRAVPVDAASDGAASDAPVPVAADKPADAGVQDDAHAVPSEHADVDAGAVKIDAAMTDAAPRDMAASDPAATDAAASDAVKIDAATTDAATSAVTQPEAAQPEAERPDVAQPDVAALGTVQADATQPEAGQPETAHADDVRAGVHANAHANAHINTAQPHATERDPAQVSSTRASPRHVEDDRVPVARAIDAHAIDRHIADAHAVKKHVARTYGADAAVMPKPAVPGSKLASKRGKRVARTSAHESMAMQRAGAASGSHAVPGRPERVDFGNRQSIVPTFVTSTDPTSRRASGLSRNRRNSADKARSVQRPPSR